MKNFIAPSLTPSQVKCKRNARRVSLQIARHSHVITNAQITRNLRREQLLGEQRHQVVLVGLAN